MLVLVDTPVWSLALRRSAADLNPREVRLIAVLRELIRDGRAQLVGPVRQELLSGIRRETTFRNLRDQLRPFDEPYLEIDDYEEAARIHNQCRSRGIAGSAIDFLLCATASRRDWQIFTTDHDFTRYATVLPLKILQITS
jgi:hypothetical protein